MRKGKNQSEEVSFNINFGLRSDQPIFRRTSEETPTFTATMLLKEYRICMPITVEEVSLHTCSWFTDNQYSYKLVYYLSFQYRLGQLYMIARHSQEESHGGEGVEVIVNEPCTDPVRGEGQYTEKRIYLHK